MTRIELEMLIKQAFYGVTLDGGDTLEQMEEQHNWGKPVSTADLQNFPRAAYSDDWTVIPVATLERFGHMAFADERAMRYYLPAFMVSMLKYGDDYSQCWVAALCSLCPESGDPQDYCVRRYALFDDNQRAACALFLRYLPELERLDRGDMRSIDCSLSRYWSQYLPPDVSLN